jgi:prepilin-type N-terminal cleavage/methylation domain-containing protein
VRLSPTRSGKVRGFTLIELMVVIVIISIMAVIAVPLFSARLQSRRLLQVAGHIADLYRGSRTRALGRGAAIVVTLNLNNGSLQVLEGVQGTTAATSAGKANCANLPTRGCLTNNWGNVGSLTNIGTARLIEGINNQGIATTATLPDGTVLNAGTLAICFSPAGRTFMNQSGTWTADMWQTLNNVAIIGVTNTDVGNQTSRAYQVLIMPNGTARLAP